MFSLVWDIQTKIEKLLNPKPETELTRFEHKSIRSGRARNWRVATEKHDSELLAMLRDVQRKSGSTGQARIILTDIDDINASYNYRADSFTLTKPAVEKLSKDELETLLGHEVGHQLQREKLAANYLGFSAIWLAASAFLTYQLTKKPVEKLSQKPLKALSVPLLVAGAFMGFRKMMQMALDPFYHRVRRYFEKDADRSAVVHVRKPQAQIDHYQKIQDYIKERDKEWDEKHDKPIAPTDSGKSDEGLEKPSERWAKESEFKKKWKELNRTHPDFTAREEFVRETAKKEGISLS